MDVSSAPSLSGGGARADACLMRDGAATILRSANPTREFSDMGPKAKLVELLVEHYPRLFGQPHPGQQ